MFPEPECRDDSITHAKALAAMQSGLDRRIARRLEDGCRFPVPLLVGLYTGLILWRLESISRLSIFCSIVLPALSLGTASQQQYYQERTAITRPYPP